MILKSFDTDKINLNQNKFILFYGNNNGFKDEVTDVREGNECGIALEKNNDIVLGDVFECFEVKETAAKL